MTGPMTPRAGAGLACAAALLGTVGAAFAGGTPQTRRVNVNGSTQANGDSFQPAISPAGNRVIFTTEATSLRPDFGGNPPYIENDFDDVYLWNGGTTVQIVSIRIQPANPPLSSIYFEGNGNSLLGAVVGNYYVFATDADNLYTTGVFNGCDDENNDRDIYAGQDLRESVDTDPDSHCGEEGNGDSDDPAISADGTRVVFESDATNFDSGDTNGVTDIYITHAGSSDVTVRVSLQTILGQASRQPTERCVDPVVNEDGTLVAFETADGNMVTSDDNGVTDVYLKNRNAGVRTTVSIVSEELRSGEEGNAASFDPSISEDGRVIAFTSAATNLGPADTNGVNDIYVRDYDSDEMVLVSVSSSGVQGNGSSSTPWVSGNGRFVAFRSFASNLVAGDTNGEADIFVRDLVGGATYRVSVGTSGAQANGTSFSPSIDADGSSIAFASDATNLVMGDTNGETDIFVRDILIPPTNDTCGSAETIAFTALTGNNEGATNQASVSCAVSGHDVWFRFVPPCTGEVNISTEGSGFDTVLAVFNECGGTQLACDDDSGPGTTSLISGLNVNAGSDYFIRLAGFGDESGDYQINIDGVRPGNDTCGSAAAVGLGAHPFSTCFATTSNPALTCEGADIANDVWFRFTPAETGLVTIHTCGSGFDTVLVLYADTCPAGPGGHFACSNDSCGTGSSITFTVFVGTSYVIRVGGATEGQGTLTIARVCPADWDQSGVINSNDYFAFLEDFFDGDADFNDDGVTDSDDYFAFLAAYFDGC